MKNQSEENQNSHEENENILNEEKEIIENYTFDQGLNKIGFGSFQIYLLLGKKIINLSLWSWMVL
jgi:hypothetical protein